MGKLLLDDYKDYIFDMDGVILSSVRQHCLAWQMAFAVADITLTREMYYKYCDGVSRSQAIINVLDSLSKKVSDNLFSKIGEVKGHEYLKLIQKKPAHVYPDFIDYSSYLRSKGKRLYVCSSSKMALPLLMQNGLDKIFDFILDGNIISENRLGAKPLPDPYQFIIDHCRLVKHETVAFEDSVSGVRSIVAAALTPIWVNRSNLKMPILEKSVYMVQDFYSLDAFNA